MVRNLFFAIFNLMPSTNVVPSRSFLFPRRKQNAEDKNQAWVEKDSGNLVAKTRISPADKLEKCPEETASGTLSTAQAKMEYLGKISHELRSPLTTIIGVSDMLEYGVYGPLSREQKDAIKLILEASQHMSRLVDDLLDQSQLEVGNFNLAVSQYNPQDVIVRLRKQLASDALAKGLSLSITIEDPFPKMLCGDSIRLFQIAQNLTHNAIKYTNSGSVKVRLYMDEPDYFKLEVSDTGIGIPHEMQDAIFEPFRQLHTEPNGHVNGEEVRGYGLGLAVVKQLVSLMSGEIHVSSLIGKGSVFTVKLPANGSMECT